MALVVLLPAVLSAKDARGDLFRCGEPQQAEPQDIDIVSASARLIEEATALLFEVEFRGRPPVPDPSGHPLRVDIVLRDPRLPDYSVGPYRKVNRIIRFEATDPPSASLLLLPEQGENQPSTFWYEDGSVRMTVAGRLLTRDDDLVGFDLRPIRWTVLARDEDRCDRLGKGLPVLRFSQEREREREEAAPKRVLDESREQGGVPALGWTALVASAGALLGLTVLARRRRSSRRA